MSSEASPEKSSDPFSPPGITFQPLAANFVKVRLLTVGCCLAICLVAAVLAALLSELKWVWIFVAVILAIFGWTLWFIPRQVRSWGYFEAEKNLFIRRGIMFKRMWAVPYGRMQYVDVSQGPIDRLFGVAKVSLKTASAESDATLPGLYRAEADRIRESLTERGEALRAGL